MSEDGSRVVVVGAGISGLAIARELASDHDVVVFEKSGIATDTSSRASGMISLSLEPIPEAWSTYAREFFRELDGRGVFSFVERETVSLVPAKNADDRVDPSPDTATYLGRSELSTRYPETFGDLSSYAGGVVYGGTGYLNALDYAMTLKWEAQQVGAGVFRDHAVTGLRVTDGDVVGVETEYGPVDAEHVVYATGWRTREQLSDHVEIPVRPLRWNAIVLESSDPLPADAPLGSEPTMRVYWRPTPRGEVLIGGNEHLLADPDETPMDVESEFRDLVTGKVVPLLSGFDDANIRREDCCPTADSASPDGRPIVDAPPEAPDGLVVVTGLHGRGVMLSPLTARTVRSLVAEEPAPFPTEGLALSRFEDRSPDFDYRSHWD